MDSLSDEAKRYLPPLPVQFTYKEEDGGAFALMQMMGKSKGNQEYLAQAQAIKDATMGWFIARNIKINSCILMEIIILILKKESSLICFNIVRVQQLKQFVRSARKA